MFGEVFHLGLCLCMCLVLSSSAKESTEADCDNLNTYVATGSATYQEQMQLSHGKKLMIKERSLDEVTKHHPECLRNLKRKKTPRKQGPTTPKRQCRRDKCKLADRCRIALPTCTPAAPYRTADGSCNNLKHSYRGMAFTPQRRVLPNRYDNGVDTPRIRASNNGTLPSARYVSNVVLSNPGNMVTDSKFSSMMMNWGQFLAHDIVLTPLPSDDNGENLDCCNKEIDNPECFNINIPADDPTFNQSCMPFSRSTPFDCDGVREQENMQSSFIDCSHIYGVSDTEQISLRKMENGELASYSEGFPVDDQDDGTCNLSGNKTSSNFCLRSGDVRINENPGLASLHVLFFREHNRLARGLRSRNPHWDDEKLFQESRKILIGLMQLITYRDWLPILLGRKTIKKHELKCKKRSFNTKYDDSLDPSVINTVTAAIMRMGHSMIHLNVGALRHDYSLMDLSVLQDTFFNTRMVLTDNIGPILRWIISNNVPKSDRVLEDSVRAELFKDVFTDSFDLGALNVNRGRDHGIPTYNDLRRFCGLPEARTFDVTSGGLTDHSQENARLLAEVYSSPDDIDAFPGSMTETRMSKTMVGPLQACLLGEQFKALKVGDRFYFERESSLTGFTKKQLNELRKHSLSRMICDNSDTPKIQKDGFKIKSSSYVHVTHFPLTIFASQEFRSVPISMLLSYLPSLRGTNPEFFYWIQKELTVSNQMSLYIHNQYGGHLSLSV